MTAAKSKTTSAVILADARLVVERGVKWPLQITILPRVRAPHKPPPCGFCRETTVKTQFGWVCPACETEEDPMNFTIEQLSTRLEDAYDRLKGATIAVQEKNAEVIRAQQALSETRQAIIAKHADDPKALGPNEAARNARIDEMTEADRQVVRIAEDALRLDRDRLEIVRIEVESLRAQLRCLEVAAGLAVNGGVR